LPDHVIRNPQYWNCRGCLLRSPNSGLAANINDVDLSFNQLRHKFWNQIDFRSISAPVYSEVSIHDEALPLKFIEHCDKERRVV
jgi:hypothetical protein